jgi:20S proteasome alpha/beta subunit
MPHVTILLVWTHRTDDVSMLIFRYGALMFAGAYFILSVMDKYYEKNMTVEQALRLVDKCIWEIGTRMVASPGSYLVKIVDKDGARLLERRGKPADEHGDPLE